MDIPDAMQSSETFERLRGEVDCPLWGWPRAHVTPDIASVHSYLQRQSVSTSHNMCSIKAMQREELGERLIGDDTYYTCDIFYGYQESVIGGLK